MQDFSNKKVLLGVCGGVAAYKSAYVVRELVKLGAEVRVVMTKSAQQFINPLQMQALSQNEVRTELFDHRAERAMGHIELARWADCLLIVPASANSMAKMAQGIADDLLSTLYLVIDKPVVICPAMNQSMWAHPATQANCQTLLERGGIMVGPEEGVQACGESGLGRLSELDQIINALLLMNVRQKLLGKQVVITAGPTREAIDSVRYISNYSSGKMGYALAEAAAMAGAQVTLISGPTTLSASPSIDLFKVETARSMRDAVMASLKPGAIFIGSAAVADYSVKLPAQEKIKKTEHDTLHLNLVKNPDIISEVVASGVASFVVGFAAETTHVIQYAMDKLEQKKLDMIIANRVGQGIGFESDQNQVTVISKSKQIELPLTQKTRLAGQIIEILASHMHNADHSLN